MATACLKYICKASRRKRLWYLSNTLDESSAAGSSRSHSRDRAGAGANQFNIPRPQPFTITHARTGSRSSVTGADLAVQVHPPPESPVATDLPTPGPRDIHLQALAPPNSSSASGPSAHHSASSPKAFSSGKSKRRRQSGSSKTRWSKRRCLSCCFLCRR